MNIVASRYTKFGDLLSDLTGRLPGSVLLAYGVRQVFTPTTGRRIRDVQQLTDGGSYVCAGFETFKPLNYGQSTSVAAFVGTSLFLRNGLYQNRSKSLLLMPLLKLLNRGVATGGGIGIYTPQISLP